MGESVSEGIVCGWVGGVGDGVEEGEPVVEVTTDKVDVEVPAPATGQLAEIVAAEGETVAVGATLAVIAPGALAAPTNGPSPAVPAAESKVAPLPPTAAEPAEVAAEHAAPPSPPPPVP